MQEAPEQDVSFTIFLYSSLPKCPITYFCTDGRKNSGSEDQEGQYLVQASSTVVKLACSDMCA